MISREALQLQKQLNQREAERIRNSGAERARRGMRVQAAMPGDVRQDVVEQPVHSAASARDLMIRRGGR